MDKKNKHKKILTKLYAAIICSILAFVTFAITMFSSGYGMKLLCLLGVITEKNYMKLAFADYALVCVIVGSILSVIVVQYPVALLQKLINAIERVGDGDYSVRLSQKKGYFRIVNVVSGKFNNMAQQLESTEMLSHDFITNFSHECKTPVNSINGFAKLLKNDSLTPEERNEYIDIIIQESEKLSNLSKSILSHSSLENTSILTNKENVNISEQIRAIIGSLFHNWYDKNIDIIFEEDEHYVNGNSDMLNLVWTNLIENAIKYTPEGGCIAVDLKSENDMITFSIRNPGNPIDEECQKRLFDKFYQADESHSTNGNGLGLAIAKRVVELHNGEIYLKKSDEECTEFVVSLPEE